tara:strand:+ start:358 stop:675 length:318 start_codon:yes stop_codon:yes gene_type:complete
MLSRAAKQKLYKTKQWKMLRAQQLTQHPYCQCLHHIGQKVRANVVDHITKHEGDLRKFFNSGNLQSMTKQCHDKFKQSQEKGGNGFDMGCDANGLPLNREHSYYK